MTEALLDPAFPVVLIGEIRRKEQTNDDSALCAANWYIRNRESIPGAPACNALNLDDAAAVSAASLFSLETHINWAGFKAYLAQLEAQQQEAFNPYLPLWMSKNEEQPNLWVSHTGMPSDVVRRRLIEAFAAASPQSSAGSDLFQQAPIDDYAALQDVVQAMVALPRYFVHAVGDPSRDALWAYGPSLCILAGLGVTYAQNFLLWLDPAEPELAYYGSCDSDEFVEDVKKAHATCGYPSAILRVDWDKLRDALEMAPDGFNGPDGMPLYLGWVRTALMCHILRHVRLTWSSSSPDPWLVASYKGTFTRIRVNADDYERSILTPGAMSSIGRAIARELRIPLSTGAKATQLEQIGAAVLADLRPSLFAQSREPYENPFFIVAGHTKVSQAIATPFEHRWIDTGSQVSNIAQINPTTGELRTRARADGADVLTYNWTTGVMKMQDLLNWEGTLPKEVTAMLPTEYLDIKVKNRNTLGHKRGADAVLNAVIILDLVRILLAGSKVGITAIKEFPPVFILPMGHTKEETTNQGKTNIGRIILGAMVPGIVETGTNPSSSAPAQRSMAEPLFRDGTALYDEFIMPTAPDHFLNASGIQTLATGGRKGPGRAGENSLPPQLRHPLFFAAKLAAVPEDIHNRMVCIFMDTLTAESRSTDEDLNDLMTGKAASTLRACAIRWVVQSGILNELYSADLAPGDIWRLNAHMTLARHFATDEEIKGYLDASKAQCKSQLLAADASGLTDDLGIRQTFDPAYYWRTAKTTVKANMAGRSLHGKHPIPLEAARLLVENDGDRKFNAILLQYNLQEKALIQRFVAAWLKNPHDFDDGEYRMVYYTTATSTKRDLKGRTVPYCEVLKAAQPPAPPAPPAPPKAP